MTDETSAEAETHATDGPAQAEPGAGSGTSDVTGRTWRSRLTGPRTRLGAAGLALVLLGGAGEGSRS